MFKVGDRVRCINPGAQRGLVKDKIYTVLNDQIDEYVTVNRGCGGGVYAFRFQLVEGLDKVVIQTCLERLRDTTNSRSEMELCTKALEALTKL